VAQAEFERHEVEFERHKVEFERHIKPELMFTRGRV
jgi:hypothetical protein